MARSFNGTSALVAVNGAQIAVQGTAFSIAFWIKAAVPAADSYAYAEGRSTTATPLFGIHSNISAHLQVILRNDANSTRLNNVTSAFTQCDGTWHHFIYAQDASNNVAYYTDGANKETTSYVTSGTLTIDRATIGALVRNTTSNWFAATLAEVAIFNRQLLDGDAAALGSGMLRAADLAPLHYWPLWGVDSPEPDLGTG